MVLKAGLPPAPPTKSVPFRRAESFAVDHAGRHGRRGAHGAAGVGDGILPHDGGRAAVGLQRVHAGAVRRNDDGGGGRVAGVAAIHGAGDIEDVEAGVVAEADRVLAVDGAIEELPAGSKTTLPR